MPNLTNFLTKKQTLILSEMLHFRQRRGLFSRPEVAKFHNQPVKYWQLHGSETPVIQELAIILFRSLAPVPAKHIGASLNKRRNKLRTEKARKLDYVHYNLKLNDIESESAIWTESTSAGTKITKITYMIKII